MSENHVKEPDQIRVPHKRGEPGFWNREALTGFLAGFGVPFIPFSSLIGMVIGGFVGKSRMREEQEKGELVSKPGMWNRNTAMGAGVGAFIGGIAGAFAGTLGSWAGYALGGGLGALIGGSIGESRMAREWEEAKHYVAEHGGEYQGRAKEQVRAAEPRVTQNIYIVTPEEAKLLSQKLERKDAPKERLQEQGPVISL